MSKTNKYNCNALTLIILCCQFVIKFLLLGSTIDFCIFSFSLFLWPTVCCSQARWAARNLSLVRRRNSLKMRCCIFHKIKKKQQQKKGNY